MEKGEKKNVTYATFSLSLRSRFKFYETSFIIVNVVGIIATSLPDCKWRQYDQNYLDGE